MPPNGPDEWRARLGHWENRKLRWYKAHCGSCSRVPLHVYLGRVSSDVPLLSVLLLLWLSGKVVTGASVAGNVTLSSLGKLVRSCSCGQRRRMSVTSFLSLFLAMTLLLVLAGDVETNPGPTSGENYKALYFLMGIHDQLLFLSTQMIFLLKLMTLN